MTSSLDKIRNSLTQTLTSEIRNNQKPIESHFSRFETILTTVVDKLRDIIQYSNIFQTTNLMNLNSKGINDSIGNHNQNTKNTSFVKSIEQKTS